MMWWWLTVPHVPFEGEQKESAKLSNPTPHAVVLGNGPARLADFVAVARHGAHVEFSDEYRSRVNHGRALVERFLKEERLIYGVTTGFGDNYKTVIPTAEAERLQRNIVESHAVSVGTPLDEERVRAIQFMQLIGLGTGSSGIALATLELIRGLLNSRIVPVAPGAGSVGYLSVEAHMARVLIGEGKAIVSGETLTAAHALEQAGLSPVVLGAKEGLSLTNGTHSVTGIAALLAHDAVQLGVTADAVSAMSFEALNGTELAFDARLQSQKRHPEQAAVAGNLRALLSGSARAAGNQFYRVQDTYSLRGIPQVHGAAKRAIADAARVIEEEINSVGDNPAIVATGDDGVDGVAIMGANFDSTFTALSCDTIHNALTVLAKISERRTDRMTNSAFSELPAFLATTPGIDNGYMIVQYTAAALTLEMRSAAAPAAADSIPTSANQEDPVSNAYLAANKSYTASQKLAYILGIEAMVAAQALDLSAEASTPAPSSSPAVEALRAYVRSIVPPIAGDRFFGDDIENITAGVRNGQLLEAAEPHTGTLRR